MPSVRGLLTPTAQGLLSKLLTALSGMAGIRQAVDSGADSPVTAFAADDAIDSDLWGYLQVATSPSDAELSQATQAGTTAGQAEDFTNAAISLIQGALGARGQMNQPERTLLAQTAAKQDLEIGDAFALATPALSALFRQIFDIPAYRQLTGAENLIASGSANRPVPVDPAAFQATSRVIVTAISSSEAPTGEVLAAESARLSHDLLTELYLAGGLGLLAVAASVFVAVRFGRRLRVELTGLFDSARQMADERLPRLVGRLRRGEDVDVLAESPPLRSGRITEIADVARAFSSVQRTAVEAAVGQAALRKGVN